MSTFLSPEEVEELTGYVRHGDQRRWLKDKGWRFEITKAGRPVVLRSFCEQMMGSQITKRDREIPLDFSSIKKAA